MARKDDIETAPLSGAARTLRGLADQLAGYVRAQVEAFIDKDRGPEDLDKTMRTVALIARAALGVHQMQAAEDKAADRALEARAERAYANQRAGRSHPDEDEETDMNERDPRLDSADGVAEIYEEARQCVAGVFERLELKRADQPAAGRSGPGGKGLGAEPDLVREGAPGSTPA